ncbi:MAG: hypothetical protein WAT39_13315, partial [Planctomycetota bacterium]
PDRRRRFSPAPPEKADTFWFDPFRAGSACFLGWRGVGQEVWTLADGLLHEIAFASPAGLRANLASLAFDRDCTRLAVGTWDGELLVRDLRTGTTQAIPAQNSMAWGVVFSPIDPDLLITSVGSGGLTFWDLDTMECCLQLLRDEAPISQLQLSRDGRTLACFTQAGPVLLDLEYRERHVAGNLATRLETLGPTAVMPPGREAELRTWAAEVLSRPWPRWQ